MSANGFFEMREKLTPPRRSAKARAGGGAGEPGGRGGEAPLSVTDLTRMIDAVLRSGMPSSVLVRGEISNFSHNRSSGHAYFTLKDSSACVNCVMFRSEFERVKFRPTDGMELLAGGEVKVYAPQGRHQLYVNRLQPLGRGALELALQQLREKLAAEGLFAAQRKRPVPRFPARIAILTSRETAALADMLKVLRRVPALSLMLYHVPVQGEGCGRCIAEAVGHLSRCAGPAKIDLILLGRGGGSLEDLWGFNDESLARAIVASSIPIITGIGHEVDVSIADLVADHWAHTPTEAATFAIRHWIGAAELLDVTAIRLRRHVAAVLQDGQRRLAGIERHELFRRPTHHVDRLRMLLDDRERTLLLRINHQLRQRGRTLEAMSATLERRGPAASLARARERLAGLNRQLVGAAHDRLRRQADRLNRCSLEHLRRSLRLGLRRRGTMLDSLAARLEALSPQQVLRRGYSLTTLKKTGVVVRTPADVKPGQVLVTRLVDGSIESTVEDAAQPRLFEA
jgi:exodeoxyribonuclease VII large subunit